MALGVWVFRLIVLLYHAAAQKASGTSALTLDYGHGLGSALSQNKVSSTLLISRVEPTLLTRFEPGLSGLCECVNPGSTGFDAHVKRVSLAMI